MSNLLNEQELHDRVVYLLDTGYAVDIIDLVTEQKQAHGNVMIDEISSAILPNLEGEDYMQVRDVLTKQRETNGRI